MRYEYLWNVYFLSNVGCCAVGDGTFIVADFGARAEEEEEVGVEIRDENW